MREVKKYLDKNFHIIESSLNERSSKDRGVFGHWEYPKGYNDMDRDIINKDGSFNISDHIICYCNNETIQFRATLNNESILLYGYLQTYPHIPRGEADKNGYYRRSTEDEVIKYIEFLFEKVFKKEFDRRKRKKKIIKISEI